MDVVFMLIYIFDKYVQLNGKHIILYGEVGSDGSENLSFSERLVFFLMIRNSTLLCNVS